MPGDVIQMDLNGEEFGHSVIVTSIRGEPNPDNIWIAAHDMNANCRPIATYDYYRIRAIHIDGVRYFHRGEVQQSNFFESLLRPRTPMIGSETPPQQ